MASGEWWCWHRWKWGDCYESQMFRIRSSDDLGLPLRNSAGEPMTEKIPFVVENQKATCQKCGKVKVRRVS